MGQIPVSLACRLCSALSRFFCRFTTSARVAGVEETYCTFDVFSIESSDCSDCFALSLSEMRGKRYSFDIGLYLFDDVTQELIDGTANCGG